MNKFYHQDTHTHTYTCVALSWLINLIVERRVDEYIKANNTIIPIR